MASYLTADSEANSILGLVNPSPYAGLRRRSPNSNSVVVSSSSSSATLTTAAAQYADRDDDIGAPNNNNSQSVLGFRGNPARPYYYSVADQTYNNRIMQK